jgi:hypothetical protein
MQPAKVAVSIGVTTENTIKMEAVGFRRTPLRTEPPVHYTLIAQHFFRCARILLVINYLKAKSHGGGGGS